MERYRDRLFSACLHFFGIFYENPPPPGCPAGVWTKLEHASRRLYSRCDELDDRSQSPGMRRKTLSLMVRDSRIAIRNLRLLPADDRLVSSAWYHLDTIVTALVEADEHGPALELN
jgi:hypothetical protein